MSKPLVSIIMSVRNMEKDIANTLDSLLAQTYSNIEIIVVDDASDDSTDNILNEYSKRDERVIVLRNSKRMNKCFSRNLAIKRSQGKYLAINDGDDISLPNRIEKEVDFLESHEEVFLVSSRAYVVNEKDTVIAKSYGKREVEDITNMLLERNVIVHSSVMFRREPIYLYRDKFTRAQDYDLFLQMVAHGEKISLLPDFLVKYKTKESILYDEYLVDQIVFSHTIRYLAKQYMLDGVDLYPSIDTKKMYEMFPKEDLEYLHYLRLYTTGGYIDGIKVLVRIIKRYGIKPKYIYNLFDSLLMGSITKIGKKIKRLIIRLSV